MKLLFLVAVIALFATLPAAAEQGTPAQEALLKRGAKKITVGAILIAAGAVALPITHLNTANAFGTGLIMTGTGVVVWGVRDRYKALQPQLAFGATVGKSKAVFVRRRW